jgi:dihydroorotase
MAERYDLLLSGGRVIDPVQGRDGILDVAIKDGRIELVAPKLSAADAVEAIDVTGKLVLPGLIDPHAHVFRYFSGVLGMDADWVGVQSGVTTLIDQGSVGAGTLPAYLQYVVKAKSTRVFVFLAPFLAGAAGGFVKDHFTPDTADVDLALRAFADHPETLRGIKFWAEQILMHRYGLEPLRKAAQIANEARVPMYVHIGDLWRASEADQRAVPADAVLEQIMPLLRPGDIFAPVHEPGRRLFRSQWQGAPDREGSHCAWHASRPWLRSIHFDTPDAIRTRAGVRPRHARRRHTGHQHNRA